MRLHGFEIQQESHIPEMHGSAALYRHVQSGAELIHLPAEDDNKVFAIGFNTYPQDDSGVAHIVEHTVLSGSEKYPVKELFASLARGSVNTYLNAMTMADKTLFAVASQNDQDFQNLVRVYIDAVFRPMIYHDQLAFRQEGWSFAFDEEGLPFYNGVVYNEMKGALASADTRLAHFSNRALFDNTYRWVSGGDPGAITGLTYEAFLDFHRTYYHPSNCRFILYGDAEIRPILAFLDEEYLSQYKATAPPAAPGPSPRRTQPVYLADEYPSTEAFDLAELSFVVGDSQDMARNMELSALAMTLFGLESSPLKQKLLAEGFCQDLYGDVDDSRADTVLTLTLYGVSETDPRKVEERVFQALWELDMEGLIPDFEAMLIRFSFQLREGNPGSYPKGMMYVFPLLGHMGTDAGAEDPFYRLRFEAPLAQAKEAVAKGHLAELLCEAVLENSYRCTVVLCANPELGLQEAEAEFGRAEDSWKALSAKERKEEYRWIKALQRQQETPDDPEALAKIPAITRADLGAARPTRDVEVLSHGKQKVLFYQQETSDILYLKLMFPLPKGIAMEEVATAASMLGNTDTEAYTFEALNRAILRDCGAMNFYTDHYREKSFLSVTVKMLPDQLERALALAAEILTTSRLDDPKRLREQLISYFARLQMDLYDGGTGYATDQVLGAVDEETYHLDQCGGIGYYLYLARLLSDKEGDAIEALGSRLVTLLQRIVSQEGLTIGISCDDRLKDQFLGHVDDFLARLHRSAPAAGVVAATTVGTERAAHAEQRAAFTPSPGRKIGFLIPAPVQAIAMGGRLLTDRSQFRGQYRVVEALLNNDYLWQELRVKGGAYGGFCTMTRDGLLVMGSYRDPNCQATLERFHGAADYLTNLQLSEQDLETYIVGAIGRFDTPLSTEQEGMDAIDRCFYGLSAEQLAEERRQLIACTPEDIREVAEKVRALMQTDNYCIIGSETAMKEVQEELDDCMEL